MKKIGVLLTNTGTPDAPTPTAVKRYLEEFLRDKQVVPLPRLLWLPLLYGIILPLRTRRSTRLYQSIWQDDSPIRLHMHELAENLMQALNQINHHDKYYVQIGMNYGKPSIKHAVHNLQHMNIDELIAIPLYPQYSNATTLSAINNINASINKTRLITIVKNYHDHQQYIASLKALVHEYWAQHGKANHLLISFHGLPQKFIERGDPYQYQCETTSALLATQLQLSKNQWSISYQSRFGYRKWLNPSTFETLEKFALSGMKTIDVICPGFSIDCLETLEEIEERARHIFLAAGGNCLRYIPALNASAKQVAVLQEIILKHRS